MTQRIIFQSHGAYGLAAIDCDTKQQILIPCTDPTNGKQTQLFLKDCIGLDDSDITRYTQGIPSACTMTAKNWNSWAEHFYLSTACQEHEWLTVAPESQLGDAVSGLSLTTKREVMILFDEFPHFVKDCMGWDVRAYGDGQSQVIRMTAENWESWLQMYESVSAGSVGGLFD